MRILIAEDDAVSRRMLQATLNSWGYEVIIVHNGIDALDALEREDAPSLAVLDIMMPGIDGLEVCRRVRRASSTSTP
ncbi:MAG: response regulator, partial [Pyrinomonadaceae bacterium]|nr:response regulator [Pyrinomonadaceae bacterium]